MPQNPIQDPPIESNAGANGSAQRPGEHYEYREIPIELIDEPSIPIRETMDEIELAEGALDIQRIGLTNPLTVFQVGERYEVIAGHRRLLECRLAGYTPVPCRVKLGTDIDPLAILLSENEHREEVNPVHQGRWYLRLLTERCQNDVDILCELVKRRRQHVEDRILLVQADPCIVIAVEKKQISLAVAAELNRIPDRGRRRILTDVAIQSGATARQVMEWRKQGAALGDVQVPGDDVLDSLTAPPPAESSDPMTCMFCEDSQDPHMMEMFWLHRPCKNILLRMLNREPIKPGTGAC